MEEDPIGIGEVGADLNVALEAVKASRGKRFVERIKALGLDPKFDLAGGDWRNCDFSMNDLAGADFRNCRLFRANFRHALVNGADFRGAGDIHTANIHLSYGWQFAKLDDHQIVLIEARIIAMQDYLHSQEPLRRDVMTDKQWFYAIKACKSFAEATLVLKEMEAAGHRLNSFAYSYVLDRAKRDRKQADGWRLFNQFLNEGGEADEALYTAGIGVAPDSRAALDVFHTMKEEMAEHGNGPGERAYNMVISRQDDNFTVALGIFHEMKRKEIHVSVYTVYALFDACQSFANAVTVLMEARRANVDINDASFLKELSDTTRYPELSEWNIRKWRAGGSSSSEVIARLIQLIVQDPFRREALDVLGFPVIKGTN